MVLFSLILVFALFLFLRGWKAESVILFFFFLTDGFGLVPNAFKGEQSLDVYANIYMLAAFVITLFQRKPSGGVPVRYVKITYAVFFAFFLLILWVNRTIYDVPWRDILITAKSYPLLLSFVVFSTFTKEEADSLRRNLFYITLFLSVVFIIQVFTGIRLLTGLIGGYMDFGIVRFKRCYNIPILVYYFVFYGLFANPLNGQKKSLSQIVLIMAFILPMHRGFIASFVVLVMIGLYLIDRNRSRFFKSMLVFSVVLLPLSGILIERFTSSTGNVTGITELLSGGDITDFDYDIATKQTMYHRAGHAMERFFFIADDPMYSAFGFGFWNDDNDVALDKVDFIVKSFNSDMTEMDIPFYTADIAWSVFFLRLGFLGTILYLSFFFSLLWFFYKNRHLSPLAIADLCCLLLVLFTSVSSVEIITFTAFIPVFMDFYYLKRMKAAEQKPLKSDTDGLFEQNME